MRWMLLVALIGVGTVGGLFLKPRTCEGRDCEIGKRCYYQYQCGVSCGLQCVRIHKGDVQGVCTYLPEDD